MRRVLFICTGNYYRSRFAESYFRLEAAKRRLAWDTDSRGLDIDHVESAGPLSTIATRYLNELGVPVDLDRYPRLLTIDDLRSADRVIAVDREEHYPMMSARFPEWADRLTYWQFEGPARVWPKAVLDGLKKEVDGLLTALETPEMPLDVVAAAAVAAASGQA